jgi:hypothetical protein
MGNPSDIIGLCLQLLTWSAPAAIPTFRLKWRKPFVLYVLGCFWYVMAWPLQGRKAPRRRKVAGKLISAG